MHIDFRQGIITYPTTSGQQTFLSRSGDYVNLTPKKAVNITFAYGNENYTYAEIQNVTNAWGPLLSDTDYWLYWNLNRITGVRTFGFTSMVPIVSDVQPIGAAPDQHWFNTTNNKMYVFKHYNWIEVIRTFAAKVNNSTFTPLGNDLTLPFAGSQVGIVSPNTLTGQIVVGSNGRSITKQDGTILIADDNVFINSSYTNTVRTEDHMIYGTALEHLNQFRVVKVTNLAKISLAHYNETHEYVMAMNMETCLFEQTGLLCLRGVITNAEWNWPTVGAPLWVLNNGLLTGTNPYTVDPYTYPVNKPPVANVLSPVSIYFNPSMGGKGLDGSSSVTINLATDSVFGISKLTVAPTDNTDPIWVGTNDPRLLPYIHPATHPATMITTDTYNFLSGSTLQLQLHELADRTLDSISNVTIYGPVVGQFLTYNGTTWVNSYVAGASTLDSLTDVVLTTPTVGQILTYNGTNWINSSLSTVTLTGDATGSGTTTIPTTLATVNATVGPFGDVGHVLQFTVNEKGLITYATQVPIAPSGGGSGGLIYFDASGGTTGMYFTGGPITTVGVVVLNGTLDIDNGGTGATTQPTAFNNLAPEQGWDPGTPPAATLWTWGFNGQGSLGDGTTVHRSTPVHIGTDTNWLQVTTGQLFQGGLKQDGTIWVWGRNAHYQFGNGTNINTSSPIQFGSDTNWKQVHMGQASVFAIKTDGTLWVCGANSYGQLGLNDVAIRSSPTQVGSLTNWKQVSCGPNHTQGIKTDGTLWSWGNNSYGQLGIGTTTSTSSPVQVGSMTNWNKIYTGNDSIHAIKDDGTLWAWGRNESGQLGDGTTTWRSSPVQIGGLNNWVSMSSGQFCTLGIQSDGTLWAWGDNYYGQLGIGVGGGGSRFSSPIQVGSLTDWKAVGCGYDTSMAIKTDGTLWTWGNNIYGGLGIGIETGAFYTISSPIQVGGDRTWVALTDTGDWSVAALKSVTEQHAGDFLSTDGYDTLWAPLPYTFNPGQAYQTYWAWGTNLYGRIGDGTTVAKSSPVQIGRPDEWKQVACAYNHTIAIKHNGTLWTWGQNSSGQLGNGTITAKSSPIQIGSLTDWIYVAAGLDSSAAIRSNHTLWTWGGNTFGQLGLGDRTPRSSPVQVGALTLWQTITASNKGMYGIRTNGTLWSWGRNVDGELGVGDITDRSSPVQVGALTNWKQVACSHTFSVHVAAVQSNGTLWTWGNNTHGELGDGTVTRKSSPVQVGALTNWKQVACGYDHVAALKIDGTWWAWGNNWAGHLGDGTTAAKSSPVQIGALTNWVDINCGYDHTGVIKLDGTMWGCGYNLYKELLTGTTQSYSSPIQLGNSSSWYGFSSNTPSDGFAAFQQNFPVVPITNGGTGSHTTTGALTNLLPTYNGPNYYVLTTDGTNVYWTLFSALP